jgi:hypothetical protein
MCTVTYIPLKEGFVLTSSRDEKTVRSTAKLQAFVDLKTTLVYPKDMLAGGTWIAASNKKQIACLLNGGFENHTKDYEFGQSRGQILLASFNYDSQLEFMSSVNLEGVKPFTLLLIDYQNDILFHELVWDGEKKHIAKINPENPRIWSSVTLYSKEDREIRQSWFNKWIIDNQESSDCKILDFHQAKHCDVPSLNILMKRENFQQTVSISQIWSTKNEEIFDYYDLLDKQLRSLNLANYSCIPVSQ